MAKYAIPAEVVFTFDDEPVDIQEMLHDNAESEEVVEGLERLLKAVAAPGFTEAEVVFDIGGGISVVRAARRTTNPRKATARGNDGQQSLPLDYGRTGNPHDYRSGDIPFQRRWIANLQRELTEAKDADTVLSTLNTLADGLPAMWAYYPKPDFCAKTFMVLDGKTDAVRFTAKDLDTLYRIVQHGFDVREPGFPRDHAAKLAHYLTGKVFHVHYVDNFTENKPFFEKVSKSVTADLQKWIDDRYGKGLFVVDNCWVWWANSFVDQSILVYPTVAFGPVLLKSLKSVLKRVLKPTRTGNPHGGGLVSGYGINTFAMDPDDYAPERQSNPRESIATMLGRPRR